jgi:hypothetical protein
MLAVCAAYLKELEGLYAGIGKAIDGLPQEALDWAPGPQMNSINVLVAHMTGSQRFLVGDMIGDIPSHRNRDAEFAAQGGDAGQIIARLNEAMAVTLSAFENLSAADLESTQPRAKNGRSFTVAAAMVHALAHSGVHAGHIEMTRQLWDQRK